MALSEAGCAAPSCVVPPALLSVTQSVAGRRWRQRLDAAGEREARLIAQRHGLPDIVARVLAGRGVDADAAEGFLDPSIRALLPDPSTLTDLDRLVARLADAVERRECVALIADYDVDGATSAALMMRTLHTLGLEPAVHVPDRLAEGYGPSVEAVRRLAAQGARLIVTLDCGSAAEAPLAEARRLGLDVLVIDHHPVDERLAPAFAIVNPNRQDDLSGLGHLAAVGVTFVVLVGLIRELRARGRLAPDGGPDLLGMLDVVALGTVCDVVPLRGLNRAFVLKGLKVLAQRGNAGLAALTDVARLKGPANTYHLGFLLGPRINAGGRIGESGLGVRLLTTDDPALAARIAATLDRLNAERQAMETAALEAAEAQVTRRLAEGALPPVLSVGSADWHPGIVGLIAARLKERYRRPAVAVGFDADGRGAGSGRSIGDVDLGAAVRAALDAGLIEKGGGHVMAAGLTVRRERLAALEAFLVERLGDSVAAARAADALKVDGVLGATGATETLCELIERAGPYGAGHPEPVFVFPAHTVAGCGEVGNGHLRLTLAAMGGGRLEAMAFRAGDTALGEAVLAARDTPHHFAGCLSLDRFRGVPRVRLRIVDAAPATAAGLARPAA